jgi:pimeloyl-ACP methyl ester carboxylesterase
MRLEFLSGSIFAVGALLAMQSTLRAETTETEIPASDVAPHAGYYAPYALQSAGAYLPVQALDKTRGTPGQDANYVVQSTFQDKDFGATAAQIRERAREALSGWRYQFGSDAYLSCINSNNAECVKRLPGKWTWKPRGGPAFHVWAQDSSFPESFIAPQSCSEVSITFRGTVKSQPADWGTNGHKLSKYFLDNYYRQLHRNIDGIIGRVTALDCYRQAIDPSGVRIVSAGHSLGGGLAQLAALANKRGPRISKVFAFDPSPVTAHGLVDKQTLAENSKGLEIDRISQAGEILQPLRAVMPQYPRMKNACNPLVRSVGVDVIRGSAVARHDMAKMAAGLVRLSHSGAVQSRPIATQCLTRYERQMTPRLMPVALVAETTWPLLDPFADAPTSTPSAPRIARTAASQRHQATRARPSVVNASVSFGPQEGADAENPLNDIFEP